MSQRIFLGDGSNLDLNLDIFDEYSFDQLFYSAINA